MTLPHVLRFNPDEVEDLAARYSYEDERGVVAAGMSAQTRGWYSKDEFLIIRRWKTSRGLMRAATVDDELLREATAAALAARSRQFTVNAMLTLPGVGLPVASTLLHFAHPDPYPIIDFRALWSLSIECKPHAYPRVWPQYVTLSRDLGERLGFSSRVLDKALWQYSKENQPSLA